MIRCSLHRITPEMLEAWVSWDCGLEPDKPLTPRQCTMLRLAFYDGWLAAQAIDARRTADAPETPIQTTPTGEGS